MDIKKWRSRVPNPKTLGLLIHNPFGFPVPWRNLPSSSVHYWAEIPSLYTDLETAFFATNSQDVFCERLAEFVNEVLFVDILDEQSKAFEATETVLDSAGLQAKQPPGNPGSKFHENRFYAVAGPGRNVHALAVVLRNNWS